MFQLPDYYHNLSLRLSEVLDDIGVNERVVMKRRRVWFLQETIFNIYPRLLGEDPSSFLFGSQTEGTTTFGLNSDIDILKFSTEIHLIQDWSEWKQGKKQFMMIQDETTSPGYCLLQGVRQNIPLLFHNVDIESEFVTHSSGRFLLRHSILFKNPSFRGVRHGPAFAIYGKPDANDFDTVFAYYCSSWPKEAEPWLQQHNVSGWPTADMKRYAAEHGCFVVAVASRSSVNQDTEWRISTSIAERCLMLSLNMTQIRCYILMKMILKTFIKPKYEDAISSFMCKNVLFHCIAETRASEWNESKLLKCLKRCLQYLYHCLLTENCPHFIIPGNNLLAGKMSDLQTKQQLVDILIMLTTNIEQSLLRISIDHLGDILCVKSGRLQQILPGLIYAHLPSQEQTVGASIIKFIEQLAASLQINLKLAIDNNSQRNVTSVYNNLTQKVSGLCKLYSNGSSPQRAASHLCVTQFCAIIGSIIVSENIHLSQAISPEALMWFSAGLNSDFSSSRLKLASALYCTAHYEQCEVVLSWLMRRSEQTALLGVCICHQHTLHSFDEIARIGLEKNVKEMIQQNIAFCVRFLPCEVNCVPEELKFEMLRSTEEDLPYRSEDDYWMDQAMVDSLPFLYFLQYKVCCLLHRPAQQQQQALNNLAKTINNEKNLGHRETALNLLGQCMEQENRNNAALRCYIKSLNIRPRNNAAKWLTCRLLTHTINQIEGECRNGGNQM